MELKSIFIEAREWFDKTGGNSYFAGRVSLNGEVVAYLPFQYGYESAYLHAAFTELINKGLIPADARTIWEARTKGYVVYAVKYESKKRDAVRFGKDWREVA
jgi:hypothetical protein